jgi:hypothetical protein
VVLSLFALALVVASTLIVARIRPEAAAAKAALMRVEEPAPTATPSSAVIPRADAELVRDGRSSCAGGALFVLPDFASADGAFDLVVHFHGATDLLVQSLAAVKLNAVVVVVNLGLSSRSYEDAFGYTELFSVVLEQAKQVMAKRHLRDPSIRRIALSAFSAGFGAVKRVLDRTGVFEQVDAVLLYDGIHTSYDEHKRLDLRPLQSLLAFARAAVHGDKLFFVTHSEIPTLDYGSTRQTTDLLLEALSVSRVPGGDTPAWPDLPAVRTGVPLNDRRPLSPRSHAESGGLFVRGYKGDRALDHGPHLLQMASTALPKLAERWGSGNH